MSTIEQRARELLAAEYERDGQDYIARLLRTPGESLTAMEARAFRAVAAALREQAGARGVVDGMTNEWMGAACMAAADAMTANGLGDRSGQLRLVAAALTGERNV